MRFLRGAVACAAAVSCSVPMFAAAQDKKAADPSAMEEVLGILRKEGLIDEATSQRLLAKQVAENKKQAADVAAPLAGLEWFGDLRLRYESFYFSSDDLGNSQDNRSRERYRARFGFKKKVNDSLSLGVRLASGVFGSGGDLRSTNTSFGEGGNDSFAPDGIFFDQVFVDLKLTNTDQLKTNLVAGKLSNPYVGKNGFDALVFDNDINMEGGFVTTMFRPSEPLQIYATVGGFVLDEDSVTNRSRTGDDAPSKDQKLVAGQLGFTVAPTKTLSFGLRGSAFQFRSLDTTFITASGANGNLAGAFGEDPIPTGATGRAATQSGKARLGELFGFVDVKASEAWPVKLYGTMVKNFTADSTTFANGFRAGEEDTAWGLGIEVGNTKKLVQLGFAYFEVEANSVVSQFMDSDLFDGFTNRRGWVFYAGREISKNVDFKLTYFDGEELEGIQSGFALTGAAQPFGSSIANADRRRLQADIILKF